MNLRVLPEAEAELEDAARWDNDRTPGLGDDLLAEAAPVLRGIAANPYQYAQIRGRHDPTLRAALIRRFPYRIVYRVRTDEVLVIAVASAFLNVLGPRVLGWGTDVIIDGIQSPTGIDLARLHRVLLLAIGLYVVSAALSIMTAWMIAGVVQRLMRRLRAQAEAKIHALTLRHIDQQARGDLLSRVTNDLDNLAQSLQQTLSQMLVSILTLIGVAVMMFTISWLLAVVALVTVPLSVFGMRKVAARARPRAIARSRSSGWSSLTQPPSRTSSMVIPL